MRYATMIVMIIILSATSVIAKNAHWAPANTPQNRKVCQISSKRYKPVFKANGDEGGVSAGFFASTNSEKDLMQINGVNINVNLLSVVVAPYFMIWLPDVKKRYEGDSVACNHCRQNLPDIANGEIIKGISINTGILESETKVSGLAVNCTFGTQDEMKGLEVNGLFCTHYTCNGVVVAPINIVNKVRGVQVGLVNKCWDGRVLQIGIINTIGRRTTPFFNFRFKRGRHRSV